MRFLQLNVYIHPRIAYLSYMQTSKLEFFIMNIYLVTTLIDWKEGRVNIEAETAREAIARTEGAIKAVKVGTRVFDTSEQEQDKEREEMYHTLIEDTGSNY
jgi:hypothetical protein